jgi:hypothetical protein
MEDSMESQDFDDSYNQELHELSFVSNFGDKELGVFWGKVSQNEIQFANHFFNYNLNENNISNEMIDCNEQIIEKPITNSSRHLYVLEELNEDIDESNGESNESSIEMSRNSNETFSFESNSIINEDLSLDKDLIDVNNVSKVTQSQNSNLIQMSDILDFESISDNCVEVLDQNINDIDFQLYSNVFNEENAIQMKDKPVIKSIESNDNNCDPFSITYLCSLNNNNPNENEINSSLGLINTENLLIIDNTNDFNNEEMITNYIIVDDFVPNVSLISDSTNQLSEKTKTDIEVNAIDLLSSFIGNEFALNPELISHSSEATEVPITCSLVNITQPPISAESDENRVLNIDLSEITPNKRDYSLKDSTLDFIHNEMDCNSIEDINEYPNEEIVEYSTVETNEQIEEIVEKEAKEKVEQLNNEEKCENKTPQNSKNVTLRSSKKKVTFAYSSFTQNKALNENNSSAKKMTLKTNSGNNKKITSIKKESGIKPPEKLKRTPFNAKSSAAKRCIDFSSSETKPNTNSGNKRNRTLNNTINANRSKSVKKNVRFSNVKSPVAHYIKYQSTPPIMRTIRPKTVTNANSGLGLSQPGFLSQMNIKSTNKSNEEPRKTSKPSQLLTKAYKSKPMPKPSDPSKESNPLIPMIVRHIGGTASATQTRSLNESEMPDITESTSFWETHPLNN